MSAKSVAHSLRKFLEEPMSFQVACDGAAGRWLADHGLGSRAGKLWKASREDARKARTLLFRALEIDSFAALDAAPASRSESLESSRNEKLHGANPRARRVAIKAFPGQELHGPNGTLRLSARQHVEIDQEEIASFATGHDAVLLVENWETFERLPALSAPICARLPSGSRPLAIWRGSPEFPIGAALGAVDAAGLPCFAYVDFDPSSLAMARALPRFVDMLAPSQTELTRLFSAYGRAALFAKQDLPTGAAPPSALNWDRVRSTCLQFGMGLPQEHFS